MSTFAHLSNAQFPYQMILMVRKWHHLLNILKSTIEPASFVVPVLSNATLLGYN
jgi:hypothetical protein